MKRSRNGRFDKGKSGNPAGRPKGSRNKSTLALQELFKDAAEELTRKAIELAKEGNIPELKLCIDRIYPRPKEQPIEFEISRIERLSDIAPAHVQVVNLVAEGKISIGDAERICRLLTSVRETMQLDRRGLVGSLFAQAKQG